MANQVRLGILTSLRQILEKRVLPSLSPLMTNPKLDKELQLLIQESFPEFCRATQNSSPPTLDGVKSEDFKEIDGDSIIVGSGNEIAVLAPSLIPASDTTHEPVFSDDEDQDDIPIGMWHGHVFVTWMYSWLYLFYSDQDENERQNINRLSAHDSASTTGNLQYRGSARRWRAGLRGNARLRIGYWSSVRT